MNIIKKEKRKLIVEIDEDEYILINEIIQENQNLIQDKLNKIKYKRYFDLGDNTFLDDYSKYDSKKNYFKYYDINRLFDLLNDKFYSKHSVNESYDYIYNIHTFKNHISKSDIKKLKISEKLVRYNFLDVVKKLKFKISDEEMERHILNTIDITNLTSKELAILLSTSKQTIYNLNNRDILPHKNVGKKTKYDINFILEKYLTN